mmetsp:Transcript_750/g.1675  ORF Transcript_750/g.1675 Transcript_750/m.1675 type:complete len:156 (+) Transcript_750:198-665(+)
MYNSFKTSKITIKTVGGEIASASTLAQKIGPLGLSPKKIGEDIAKKTKKYWNGILVTVLLIIYKRKVHIKIVPTASSLIRRELSKNNQTSKNNITLKQMLKIGRKMSPKSYSKTFTGVCLELLGTCNTLKISIEGVRPKVFQKRILDGEIVIEQE